MIIKDITVEAKSEQGEGGLVATELVVSLRYSCHPLEASRVADLLKDGSQTPSREFWECLDWGYVADGR
jgi:hypothetical protein